MSINVMDGDFVVVRNTWDVMVIRATRSTKMKVFYIEDYWTVDGTKSRERSVRLQDTLFAGPEPIASHLAQQLMSSEAQLNQDATAAEQRRDKRDQAFIAKALSLPRPQSNTPEK